MKLFQTYKNDLPAGLVVFLVALPLCLGIALASGAPLFSGVIAGIVGGIVVGFLSDSKHSVSGPAAGLTVIVFSAIVSLGSFEVFLVSVVLAGLIQLGMGYARAGVIGHFFPVSVINGMLTAIGLSIVLKQIPHALGYDLNDIDFAAFRDNHGHNTFSELYYMLSFIQPGPVIISAISLVLLYVWDSKKIKSNKVLALIPGPLVVVALAVGLNALFQSNMTTLAIGGNHLVSIPEIASFQDFIKELRFPDFKNALTNSQVYVVAITIAVVASLESLLSLDASDKIAPGKRISSPNQELKAQGWGNIVSGLIGGLPVTAVIVRSSANVNSGAKGKLSAVFHGVLLLVSVLFLSQVINLIPLAVLAAVLIQVGLKLNKVSIYKKSYKAGWDHFIPFVLTIVVILLTDLLKGIAFGMLVGFMFTLKTNFRSGITVNSVGNNYMILIKRNLYFFNKAQLRKALKEIPEGAEVLIDGTSIEFMDYDIKMALNNFIEDAHERNIHVEVKQSETALVPMFKKAA